MNHNVRIVSFAGRGDHSGVKCNAIQKTYEKCRCVKCSRSFGGGCGNGKSCRSRLQPVQPMRGQRVPSMCGKEPVRGEEPMRGQKSMCGEGLPPLRGKISFRQKILQYGKGRRIWRPFLACWAPLQGAMIA